MIPNSIIDPGSDAIAGTAPPCPAPRRERRRASVVAGILLLASVTTVTGCTGIAIVVPVFAVATVAPKIAKAPPETSSTETSSTETGPTETGSSPRPAAEKPHIGSPLRAARPTIQRVPDPFAIDPQHFSFRDSDTLGSAFDALEYDLKAIRNGKQRVPRLMVRQLPSDYTSSTSGQERKRIFIGTVLPLVLEANRRIAADRQRLVRIAAAPAAASKTDQAWVTRLAARYKLRSTDYDELLRRVNVVPPSLALAQAVVESGWGSSRFANHGNSLFGQWAWRRGAGIVPNQRDEGARHSVRRFSRLLDSVRAYMHNLNTHRAYKKFRKHRVALSEKKQPLSGARLAESLSQYSIERGEYVRKIKTIIRYNRLTEFDSAQLRPTDTKRIRSLPSEGARL